MAVERTAKLLRIHCSESDHYRGSLLHEAIVEKCRELKIAGATVFRGLEGFGDTSEIHRHHLLAHDQPIVITIVDSAESLERLIPVVEEMIGTGMMALSEVVAMRVRKSAGLE
jgi:PII-like signaling protein